VSTENAVSRPPRSAANLKMIDSAIQVYYAEDGVYPPASSSSLSIS
jgi:hypothetical protein